MVNEEYYENMKNFLLEKVTCFNLCCNKFYIEDNEKDLEKALSDNGQIIFSLAGVFTLNIDKRVRIYLIKYFLLEIAKMKGEDLKLIINNSIILWNRYGLYLTVFPFEMLSKYRKTIICRIKDDRFGPIPVSTLDKEVSVDDLHFNGRQSNNIRTLLKENNIYYLSWNTKFRFLKRISGISKGTVQRMQDALAMYEYYKDRNTDGKENQ